MENNDARVGSSETIGAYLRDNRMGRDISLEEVNAATGISTAVLQALENEDKEQLPSEVYIKAFYKKYAEYLSVDPEEIQAKYQQQAQSLKKVRRRFNFSPVTTLKGEGEKRLARILHRLLLPVAIFVLGVLLYWIYNNYLAAPYNPLGFYREHVPAFCSLLFKNSSGFFC